MIDSTISHSPHNAKSLELSRQVPVLDHSTQTQDIVELDPNHLAPRLRIEATSQPCLSMRTRIEQVVARVFGVARGELGLATRGRAKVALARQVAMYLAHVVYGLSLTEVGRVFKRDRTTVSYACGIIEDRRDDQTFDRVMDNLETIVLAWSKRRHPGKSSS